MKNYEKMTSKPSDLSDTTDESWKHDRSSSFYPDYPKKADYSTLEDFDKAVKTFFKAKGFKHNDDFSDSEKVNIVEDCVMNLMGPKKLSEKYNTLVPVVCQFIRAMGFQNAPDNLSNFPDYPKKSDDISIEEYKKITKKYWKKRVKDKSKEKKREDLKTKVQHTLENLVPENLADYPDFPEFSRGDTKRVYAEKIEYYWENRKKNNLKRKLPDSQAEEGSEFWESLGKKKKVEDFSELEQNTIVEERSNKRLSPEVVAEKHNTSVDVIKKIITNHNFRQKAKNAAWRQKVNSDVDKNSLVWDGSAEMITRYECSLCSTECPDQTSLDEHLNGKQHKKKLEMSLRPVGHKFECRICDIETTDQVNLDMHFAGMKHQKNADQLERELAMELFDEELSKEVQRPIGSKLDKSEIMKSQFQCDTCNIATTDQSGLDQHLSGKNHQKKVVQLKKTEEQSKEVHRGYEGNQRPSGPPQNNQKQKSGFLFQGPGPNQQHHQGPPRLGHQGLAGQGPMSQYGGYNKRPPGPGTNKQQHHGPPGLGHQGPPGHQRPPRPGNQGPPGQVPIFQYGGYNQRPPGPDPYQQQHQGPPRHQGPPGHQRPPRPGNQGPPDQGSMCHYGGYNQRPPGPGPNQQRHQGPAGYQRPLRPGNQGPMSQYGGFNERSPGPNQQRNQGSPGSGHQRPPGPRNQGPPGQGPMSQFEGYNQRGYVRNQSLGDPRQNYQQGNSESLFHGHSDQRRPSGPNQQHQGPAGPRHQGPPGPGNKVPSAGQGPMSQYGGSNKRGYDGNKKPSEPSNNYQQCQGSQNNFGSYNRRSFDGNSGGSSQNSQGQGFNSKEDAKVFKFCCDICDIEATDQTGLDNHFAGKNHSKQVAKLEAKYLSKNGNDKTSVGGVKSADPTYDCTICELKMSSQKSLADHLDGKQHKKKLDLYLYPNKNIQEKIATPGSTAKTPKLELDCSICEMKFQHQNSLDSHLAGKAHKKKSESVKDCQFRCDICNIETTDQNGLDQHLSGKSHQKKAVELENSEKNFDCSVCDMKCRNQMSLDSHLAGKAHKKKLTEPKTQPKKVKKKIPPSESNNTLPKRKIPHLALPSLQTQNDYPDFPARTSDMSKEDFDEVVKKWYELKGLKHIDEFNEDEKKSIVEANSVKMIGPVKLSQKYNTMVSVIRKLLDRAGASIIPDDISRYPDFPIKSENMSPEEYQAEVKKYWKKVEKDKKKEKKQREKLAANPISEENKSSSVDIN